MQGPAGGNCLTQVCKSNWTLSVSGDNLRACVMDSRDYIMMQRVEML